MECPVIILGPYVTSLTWIPPLAKAQVFVVDTKKTQHILIVGYMSIVSLVLLFDTCTLMSVELRFYT